MEQGTRAFAPSAGVVPTPPPVARDAPRGLGDVGFTDALLGRGKMTPGDALRLPLTATESLIKKKVQPILKAGELWGKHVSDPMGAIASSIPESYRLEAKGVGVDIPLHPPGFPNIPEAARRIGEVPHLISEGRMPRDPQRDFRPEQLPGKPGWREEYYKNVPMGERTALDLLFDPLNLAVPGVGTAVRQSVPKVLASGAKDVLSSKLLGNVGAAISKTGILDPIIPPDLPSITPKFSVSDRAEAGMKPSITGGYKGGYKIPITQFSREEFQWWKQGTKRPNSFSADTALRQLEQGGGDVRTARKALSVHRQALSQKERADAWATFLKAFDKIEFKGVAISNFQRNRNARQLLETINILDDEIPSIRNQMTGFSLDDLIQMEAQAAAGQVPSALGFTDDGIDVAVRMQRKVETDVGRGSRTVHEIVKDTLDDLASAAGLPRAAPPPAVAARLGPDSEDVVGNWAVILEGTPNEHLGSIATRRLGGAFGAAGLEVQDFIASGNRLAEAMKIGSRYGQSVKFTKEQFRQLVMAAEGETPDPLGMEPLLNHFRQFRDLEESAMRNVMPSFQRAMDFHPDYFPHIMRPPGVAKGSGSQPGFGAIQPFMRPRELQTTWSQLLDDGWEPVSYNIFEMMALRRLAGIRFRAGVHTADIMQQTGVAVPASTVTDAAGKLDKGWKIPDIGPAFSGGLPVSMKQGTRDTVPLAIPEKLSAELESIWGTTSDLAKLPIFKYIQFFSQSAKRLKLLASFFQHVDITTRTLGAAFTPTGIARGAPLKYPSLFVRILLEGAKPIRSGEELTKRILSNPRYKMILDAGGMFGQDLSMIRRAILQGTDDIITDVPQGMNGLVTRRIKDMNQFVESNLFDVTYRENQMFAVDNFLWPKIKRMNPTWTEQQIAAQVAKEMNLMYSTLAPWQNLMASPNWRTFLRTLFFSSNEAESWMKQAINAFRPGKEGALWREYALGLFTFLGLSAVGIHYASTGEHLPLKRFMPVTADNWGPFPIGYNRLFLRPDLPWVGRGGSLMNLDTLGQADSAMRMVLDPVGAFSSRENVLVRAAHNVIAKEDFYGRPLDSLKERAIQFALDVGAPIGPGNALEILRGKSETASDILPPNADRIGTVGNVIRLTGINIGAETTPNYLNRLAQQSGFTILSEEGYNGKPFGAPVEEWADLEPAQSKIVLDNNPEAEEEFKKRQETSALRGNMKSKIFQQMEDEKEIRLSAEKLLVDAWKFGTLDGKPFDNGADFRRILNEINLKSIGALRQLYGQLDTPEPPSDSMDFARYAYYKIYEDVEKEFGFIDFEAVEEGLDELASRLTKAQMDFIERNLHLSDHNDFIKKMKSDRRKYKSYFEVHKDLLVTFEQQAAYRSWKRLRPKMGTLGDSPASEYVLGLSPEFEQVEAMEEFIRERMRLAEPGLAMFLFTWYGNQLPEHMRGGNLEEQLIPGLKHSTFAGAAR